MEYLNNRTKVDIYRARIRAYNFKGSLDVVVRRILEFYCRDPGKESKSEFKIGTFLSVYTKRSVGENRAYQNYVDKYKSACQVKIDSQMAEDMWILNALTSSSNHDSGYSNQIAGKVYQETVDEFFENPSSDYYRILSSYIRFIALHASHKNSISEILFKSIDKAM